MPTGDQILTSLSDVANNWRLVAVFWHGYFAVLAAGLVVGLRPSNRTTGLLLSLPLLSVSALAWMTGNPFNGTVFAFLGIVLISVSICLLQGKITISASWTLGPGLFLFLFGFVYPQFTLTSSPFEYLFTAPTGLIPCPTLSIVIGASMILGCLGSRVWPLVLGLAALFFGVYGATYLGVAIDWVLFGGALLLIFMIHRKRYGNQKHVESV